eukprot:6174592-Pleurochrysis_carterae.AAC.1
MQRRRHTLAWSQSGGSALPVREAMRSCRRPRYRRARWDARASPARTWTSLPVASHPSLVRAHVRCVCALARCCSQNYVGPVNTVGLKQLLAHKYVSGDTYVWAAHAAGWQRLDAVAELSAGDAARASAAPPALSLPASRSHSLHSPSHSLTHSPTHS